MPRKIKPIVRALELPAEDLRKEVDAALGEWASKNLGELFDREVGNFRAQQIVKGHVVALEGNNAVIDIGYKSDGVIELHEFPDPAAVKPGMECEVLLEAIEEDMDGGLLLSKRKADRIRAWNTVISKYGEGDQVTGKVLRKIKGGLLVDIGVPVFLPASQVSIRRANDIGEFLGREVECKIIKIDESRMNIVVSVRKLIEEQRARMKEGLLSELVEGQRRPGVVKNIVDFGAFVDLGGIDGLLHVTDMTWGRITHPSELLHVEQTIEVKVLKVDRQRERIALGLKQLQQNPWDLAADKYPVDTRVRGVVTNLMSYGAFVKLEEGVEGLVHVSEMSWTKRVQHPNEVVKVGDVVDVVVLDVNRDKQEISLGMKQVETNPWTMVENKFPIGTIVKGVVRNLTNYGAFVELAEGIDGLLHVTDMSWTRKVTNPAEIVKKGDELECVVLSVDSDRKRVALGLKQLREDPWKSEIPSKYRVSQELRGTVTKITNFGVFVELESDLEGLLHISELSGDRKVKSPEKLVKEGQEIEVEIIKIDPHERKIGLSLVGELPALEAEPAPAAAAAVDDTAPATAEAAPAAGEDGAPSAPAAGDDGAPSASATDAATAAASAPTVETAPDAADPAPTADPAPAAAAADAAAAPEPHEGPEEAAEDMRF